MLTDKTLLRTQAYINGQWLEANNKKTFPVTNPANGEVIANVPDLGQEETEQAINAAKIAWEKWRVLSSKERATLLKRWHDLILANRDDLATLLTLEQGKPLEEAKGEISYGAMFIEWFAEEAKRICGDTLPTTPDGRRLLTIKQSIGVVAAITPWNFPNAMITRKCAPALAAGCTVVIKPAEDTPLSALALAVLAERAGMPAGVINVITSNNPELVGKTLTLSPVVRKVSFTGSTAVGKLLMQQSASTVKKISLELGGNAPFIVFDDADIDAAVKGAMAAKFRNSGQTCICPNRFLIHDAIYDEFAKRFAAAVNLLKVGDGFEQNVTQGPLINQQGLANVESHIKDAVNKGARILTGGKQDSRGGTFFEPTVLTEVNTQMQLAHEEIFGPVAPLFRFKDIHEAINLANATEYGLAAYFYSQHIDRILYVAEALEYGMVCVNTGIFTTEVAPFGGVKESGIGREGSKYGLEEYIEIKSVCIGSNLKPTR